jgi:hypothetical protein
MCFIKGFSDAWNSPEEEEFLDALNKILNNGK